MQLIQTGNAPLPRGHYSQAVVANGWVFVSGQLPVVPGARGEIPQSIESQIEQVFENVGSVLVAAGSALDRLVSVQIFIASLDLWTVTNQVYQRILGDHKPARTVVPCGPLRGGALLEVNAIAIAP